MRLGGSQVRSDLLFEHFVIAAPQAFRKRVEGSDGSWQEGSVEEATASRCVLIGDYWIEESSSFAAQEFLEVWYWVQ